MSDIVLARVALLRVILIKPFGAVLVDWMKGLDGMHFIIISAISLGLHEPIMK
jgi:hypothetical protein